MANIDLVVYEAKRSATGVNFTDNKVAAIAANTYYFPNDGATKLIVQSTAGADVTIETPGTVDGLAVADKVIAIAATKVYVIGPFPTSTYNDTATGKVKVTVSANTDILAFRG